MFIGDAGLPLYNIGYAPVELIFNVGESAALFFVNFILIAPPLIILKPFAFITLPIVPAEDVHSKYAIFETDAAYTPPLFTRLFDPAVGSLSIPWSLTAISLY